MKQPTVWRDYFSSRLLSFCTGWRHTLMTYCRFHSHRNFEMVYHLRGGGSTIVQLAHGRRTIHYEEGAVIVYPPRMVHDQTQPPFAEDICLLFTAPEPWPKALQACLDLPSLRETYLREEFLSLTRVSSAPTPLEHLAYSHRLTALFIHLLASADKNGGADTQPISVGYAGKAKDYIHSHFNEIRQVEDIAREVGISYNYLRHLFKKTYGISLVNYLNEMRCNWAKELLLHSHLPLKMIAEICHFSNERYFSSCIKKWLGMPPGAFRASKRADLLKG